jgi:hypothetical protein
VWRVTTSDAGIDTAPARRAELAFRSSDAALDAAFDWARQESLSFVRTGRRGELPSYWAGLQDRPMFYSRDLCHQAVAGHLLGLDVENYVMLEAFARSATARRWYYPLWAFLFDGTPAAVDYRDDDEFVREVPAVFEIAETSLRLYLWTGDRRYLTASPFAEYYANLVRGFLPGHDVLGIGVAGEQGTGDIFAGSATYNESGAGTSMQVAGDGLACQWAALNAIASLVPDVQLAAEARQIAELTQALFLEGWWEEPGGHYLTGLADGRRVTDFGYEPSWFPAVKGLLPAGPRAAAHLSFLSREIAKAPPANIEAFTYLPEVYFAHGHNDTALDWVRFLYESRSDYPEVPFTLVQHLCLGLTGLSPQLDGTVTSRSHLPGGWVEVSGVACGSAVLAVRHDGPATSTLTVIEGDQPVRWVAHVGTHTVQQTVHPGESVRVSA